MSLNKMVKLYKILKLILVGLVLFFIVSDLLIWTMIVSLIMG